MNKKPTASDRTIPLWREPEPEVVEERPKERSDFDPDEPLVRWTSQAQGEVDGISGKVRFAKFRNGRRGFQIVRGVGKQPHFNSTMVLHPDEYFMMAQCIFRDSKLIQKLVERHPEGTDPDVDAIRDFLRRD